LPAGFAVAVATGVRPLGGIVLVVLAALAARWGSERRSKQVLWYVVVAACFAASHVLGQLIGAWGGVALVAAVATTAYATIVQRRQRPAGAGGEVRPGSDRGPSAVRLES
jgi:hypothetical protein